MCVPTLRSIATKMQTSYILFDNFASRFQNIIPTLCDTIPEHVVESNIRHLSWLTFYSGVAANRWEYSSVSA